MMGAQILETRRVRTMNEKKDCLHAENETWTISKGWVVTDGGAEIATIAMSVTTPQDFRADYIEKLLSSVAKGARSFYLELGTALKAESERNAEE